MSDASKCDRCGKLFEGAQLFRQFEVREDILKNSTTPSINHKHRDLCSECYSAFEEWWDNE